MDHFGREVSGSFFGRKLDIKVSTCIGGKKYKDIDSLKFGENSTNSEGDGK